MKTLLGLCLGVLLLSPLAAPVARATDDERHRRVYQFEHRLLPAWTHQSDGAFYRDLAAGHAEQLIKAAHEIVGSDFATALRLRSLTEPAAVLITFPAPAEVPQCFFAAVVKTESGFRYLTAEKALDLENTGIRAALCEWSAEGSHALMNFTTEVSEEWFLKAIRQLLASPAEKSAGVTPPKK